MKNKNKKLKLSFKKIQIAKISKPDSIYGGTGSVLTSATQSKGIFCTMQNC